MRLCPFENHIDPATNSRRESRLSFVSTDRRTTGRNARRVFAIPGFARLLASQARFDIGAVVRTAAQSWVMQDFTGSNLWGGLVSGMHSIPILVFPIFAYIACPAFWQT